MAKKSKLMSWFGLGKSDETQAEQATQSDNSAQKQNAEQLKPTNTEAEQVAQENVDTQVQVQSPIAHEAQNIEQEKAKQAQIEAEKLAIEKANLTLLEEEQEKALAQKKRLAEQADNMHREQAKLAAENAEKTQVEQSSSDNTQADPLKKEGFFSRLKHGLLKTRVNIGSGFVSVFSGKKIDDDLFEELETQLLTADLGVDTTMKLIDSLTVAADRKQLKDGDALYELMKQEMASLLKSAEQPLAINADNKPFVILMVGVNGVGKTTTIGKLAKQFQSEGKSVMLAAGDTFRAAAVEQLQVWGERNGIPVIAQHTGADSASVVYDAFEAAKARNVDVLIADTAGRLQNKDNLMQELEKIARVMKKIDANAPHEVMLTIDAGTGQNAISQVNLFNKCVGLTGITLSKLDGTAKGGVIFAVADKYNIPIRYIGVGEGIGDLRTFKSDDFIEALFSQDEDDV